MILGTVDIYLDGKFQHITTFFFVDKLVLLIFDVSHPKNYEQFNLRIKKGR